MSAGQGQPPPSDPIIITIVDPPSELEGLGDVLLGALGVTGAIVLAALVCGVLLGAGLLLARRFMASDEQPPVV